MKRVAPVTTVFYAVVICCLISPTVSVQSCRSYGGQNGKCVDLRRCPPLLAVILSKEKTTEHIRILQQLTCLVESKSSSEPVVCCPDGEIVSSSYIQEDVLQNRQPTETSSQAPTTQKSYTESNGRVSPAKTSPPSIVLYPSSTMPTTERSYQNTGRQGEESLSAEERLRLNRKFMSLIPPLANCSLSDVSSQRIIGGIDVEHGEYPMMARLGYKNMKTGKIDYYCGGTIINQRYILTAAHCTSGYDDSFELVHIRLGEHNTKELTDCSRELDSCSIPENIPVERVITHPEYDTMTKHNDIALVRLSRNIGFQTFFIKPVCLPFEQYGLPETKMVNSAHGIVVGWGRTNWTRIEGSSILQHVRLPLVATDKCVRDFKNRVKITDEQLCAGGERNQDSCSGDSGGPLLINTIIGERDQFLLRRKFQFGIVSFGPVKCGIGIPGVYTRVTKYLSWILQNMEA